MIEGIQFGFDEAGQRVSVVLHPSQTDEVEHATLNASHVEKIIRWLIEPTDLKQSGHRAAIVARLAGVGPIETVESMCLRLGISRSRFYQLKVEFIEACRG